VAVAAAAPNRHVHCHPNVPLRTLIGDN
jgi:hypothetical protein